MFEGAGPAELEAAATREEDAAVEQVRGLLKQRGVPEPKWLESATLLKPAGAARCPPRETHTASASSNVYLSLYVCLYLCLYFCLCL